MNTTIISESEKLGVWIYNKVDSLEYPDDTRCEISKGCLFIALQHHHSVVTLLKNNCYISAATLLRPIFESCARGIWFRECASESEIEKFICGNLRLSIGKCIGDIEKSSAHSNGMLAKIKHWNNELLNDFVHTGCEQIVMLNSKNTISPHTINNEHVGRIIGFADSMAIFSGINLCELAGEENSLMKEFLKKAGEYGQES